MVVKMIETSHSVLKQGGGDPYKTFYGIIYTESL